MANAPQPARRNRRKAVVAGLVAAPLAVLAFSGSAQAAELTPVAEYLDQTVADTEAQLGAVLDDLGLKAAE
ncbi:hypothetical protein [Pseudonocardia endophytica]|uniref:Uncharacterized protein n=1 Tax=Pseudonocardia endophytica TaxID=401976 RepID=A0A4R1I9W3_PSEEN|nr:hypothetical protein [Pseudonocardia endophytica]TCK27092.1 hypothetical protein EV378_2948 [Pseudonocardia endophytica]